MNISAEKNIKSSRTFNVGTFGVAKNEFKRLSRILGVTNYRSRSYRLIEVNASDKQVPPDIDIYIVNTGDPKNVLQWHRYLDSSERPVAKNIVKLSSAEQFSDSESYSIGTPINPIRVLQTLDNYTIKELNYFPEFEIGSEKNGHEQTIARMQLLRDEQSKERSDKPSTNKKEKQIKALVVDDSLAVRRQLEVEFNLLNANTQLVENGEMAIDAASRHRFDIIFLDVVMPGIDGYATCKKIRKSELNRKTPVILLTSRSSSFDKLKGTLAGCNTYLTKPINHNEFDEIANQFLRNK